MAEKPTREQYDAARAEYGELAKEMEAAQARRDYKRRAALARKMLPLEEVLNAYEGESHG